MISRREIVIAGIGVVLLRPAFATPQTMAKAIADFSAGATPRAGRITFDIATLVDNGNAVPVTVRVESPMTAADHVKAMAIFNEHNPNTEIARFELGPRTGRAEVSTRIRLATSQQLIALAKMNDGSVWQQTVDVVVSIAACTES